MLHLQLCSACYTELQMCKKVFYVNPVILYGKCIQGGKPCPNNHLRTTESCTSFVTMFCYIALQMNSCVKNFSPGWFKKKGMTKPVGSHIVLLQINTLHCQQKELEHRRGLRQYHDACYVTAAVGKKACLGTKQKQ